MDEETHGSAMGENEEKEMEQIAKSYKAFWMQEKQKENV